MAAVIRKKHMHSITTKLVLLAALCVASIFLSPWILYRLRMHQFQLTHRTATDNSASLSFDLQGDYTVIFDSVENRQLDTIIPALRKLPTGFTFIGPGEGRHFYVTLCNSTIDSEHFDNLCRLPITTLTIANCPNLTDNSLQSLLSTPNANALVLLDDTFSVDAVYALKRRLPNTQTISK